MQTNAFPFGFVMTMTTVYDDVDVDVDNGNDNHETNNNDIVDMCAPRSILQHTTHSYKTTYVYIHISIYHTYIRVKLAKSCNTIQLIKFYSETIAGSH